MKTVLSVRFILSVLFVSGWCGCAPGANNASDAKDVGIVSGEKNRFGFACGAKADATINSDPQSALQQAYSVLPERLRAHFPISYYELKTQAELNSACPKGRNAVSSTAPDLRGCWVAGVSKVDANNVSVAPPKILLLKDSAAIHKTLVAMTGYAFAEYYVDFLFRNLPAGTDGTQNYKAVVDYFDAMKVDLIQAYLGDANSNGGDLEQAKAQSLRACFGNTGGSANASQLGNFLFAETFDSFYCSSTSYGSLTKLAAKAKAVADAKIAPIFGKQVFQ